MPCDPKLKRERLVIVRNRIQGALEEKFWYESGSLRRWRTCFKGFDSYLKIGNVQNLESEIKAIKALLISEDVFTPERTESFGNGHEEGCGCEECSRISRLWPPQRRFYGILRFNNA
jgi:hypothetical protein